MEADEKLTSTSEMLGLCPFPITFVYRTDTRVFMNVLQAGFSMAARWLLSLWAGLYSVSKVDCQSVRSILMDVRIASPSKDAASVCSTQVALRYCHLLTVAQEWPVVTALCIVIFVVSLRRLQRPLMRTVKTPKTAAVLFRASNLMPVFCPVFNVILVLVFPNKKSNAKVTVRLEWIDT